MELKDDAELRRLLREWNAPAAPASLEKRVLERRRSWWRPLIFGYLRVPVPLACCLAIVIAAGAWKLSHPASAGCSAETTPLVKPAPVDAHNAQHRLGCAPDSSC